MAVGSPAPTRPVEEEGSSSQRRSAEVPEVSVVVDLSAVLEELVEVQELQAGRRMMDPRRFASAAEAGLGQVEVPEWAVVGVIAKRARTCRPSASAVLVIVVLAEELAMASALELQQPK